MGMGIAFTFLGLAVLLAPILWLVWWAADSVGNRPLPATATAVRKPRPDVRRTYFDYPRPADVTLPGRPDLITVYRAVNARADYTCKGPAADGRCPIAKLDGSVPCSGCTIVLPTPVRGSREWHIPAGSSTCLVGSFGAFTEHPRA